MNMKVQKKQFEKVLSPGSSLLGNTMIPVLECYRFEVNDELLKVTASDMKTTVKTSCSVQCEHDFSICVPGKDLFAYIKRLPDQVLEIEVSESTFTIKHASGKFQLGTFSASDYPDSKFTRQKNPVTMDSKEFTDILDKCLRSVSKDDLRPQMTGVCFESEKYKPLQFTSTDAFSLTHVESKIEPGEEFRVILHPDSANFLKRNLPDGFVEVHISRDGITCFNEMQVDCALIDSNFPQYQGIIPTDFCTELVLDKDQLLSCLNRIEISSNSQTSQVIFKLSNGILLVEAQDLDTNKSGSEAISGEQTGEDITIAFNSKLLNRAISGIDSETLTLKFAGDKKPAIAEGVEQGNYKSFFLVMPIVIH